MVDGRRGGVETRCVSAKPRIVGTADATSDPVVIAPDSLRKRLESPETRRKLATVKALCGVVRVDGVEVLVLPRSTYTSIERWEDRTFLYRVQRVFMDEPPASLLRMGIKPRVEKPAGVRWRPDGPQRMFVVGDRAVVDVGPLPPVIDVYARAGFTTRTASLLILELRAGKGRAPARRRTVAEVAITAEARRLARRLRAIATDGGPVLVLPVGTLGRYRGAGGDGAHYDAACGIGGLAAVVAIDGVGDGLALAGPASTIAVPTAGGAILLRKRVGADDAAFVALALAAPARGWKTLRGVLTVPPPGGLAAIDAVDSGREARPLRVQLTVAPGDHAVDVLRDHRAVVEDVETGADLIRIRRISRTPRRDPSRARRRRGAGRP
jgi:hypothetical protein